ncbi:TPA: gp58-like family protein [Streptococcus pyogenes]|uniref:gp58-like family protein n=1 Tax=Streptococcus pyogenes TaxID=1314 RepID=UPI00109BB507|nr:gp58-like family protein [Streptococcus pyogenes]QBX14700.1 hyaluronidase [Streptococcus phage Javan151]QBX19181.1 hyaluronidase [Streptococcus phage Javan471]QCK31490.1 hyaluronidase [Streptococcus pyogenes]VGQ99194.1 gp58-like family protein [Streptococcus pyogenes]VGR01356.1 gp58-like family protein [Streptococcus pyogenes]
MSRDPTILIDESNLTIGSDGRAYYTFKADGDTKSVKLANDKCIGTTRFNQIMIERGDKATNYVAPVVVKGSGESTGVFKSLEEMLSGLQSINLELTDTDNSNLWSKIKLTTNGMLREYHRDNITTEIVESANGIATRISKDTDKKLALINETVSGIRREYQDAERKLSSSYQAGINGLKATMANDKNDLKAVIQATAQGLSQKYDDKLHQLSTKITTTSSGTTEAYENKLNSLRAEFTRSNEGMRTVLESRISGLQSTQQSTARQISQEIKDRAGAVSRVQQDLASYQRRLQDTDKNYSSLQQTVSGLQSDVNSPNSKLNSRISQLASQIDQRVTRADVTSIINQSGDSIKLAIQKAGGIDAKMSAKEIVSAINLNGYGVRISGERIALDGNTTVNGAFGAKLGEFIKLRADQIIGGTIDANKINVININASSIVGLDANFIKAKIEYAITSLLEGKVIRARNGAMMIDLNNSTIDFNSDASINFNSNNNALVRKSGTHTAFVHFGNATPKNFTRSALYASIGITSSGDGINSASSGRFCGARFFRTASGYEHTASVDQAEIYGDTIIFADDFGINRGFKMTPTGVNTLVDINKMYYAIVALARCWKHLQNVGWDTTHPNFTSAIMNEHSNYMSGI